jgi:hypothetical protein
VKNLDLVLEKLQIVAVVRKTKFTGLDVIYISVYLRMCMYICIQILCCIIIDILGNHTKHDSVCPCQELKELYCRQIDPHEDGFPTNNKVFCRSLHGTSAMSAYIKLICRFNRGNIEFPLIHCDVQIIS